MNLTPFHPRFVQAEMEHRYGRSVATRARPDSSLEVLRRTMRRNARREQAPEAR